MFFNILDNIQKYLFVWILGAVVFGLIGLKVFGGYSFSPLICVLAAIIMVLPSFVPLAFGELKKVFSQAKIISFSLLFNFVVAPSLAIILGYLFLQDNYVVWLGLIILSLLPGGGMVSTWASKSGADMSVTIGMVIANLLVAVLVFPLAISIALNKLNILSSPSSSTCALDDVSGGAVSCFLGGGQVSALSMILPLIVIVFIPLVLAYFLQLAIIKKKGKNYFDQTKNIFGKISNAGLVVVLFLLMGIKNNTIIFSDISLVFKTLLPLVLFYIISIAIILLFYKKYYQNALGKALVWGSSLRYITLALGIAISLVYQNGIFINMVVVMVLSYFIQIPLSFLLFKYLKN